MNKIIAIVGPTGVGKTKLSIELAKHFNGEIINADSMQVYEYLNIGTAKITESEKENIPHHLFDIVNVEDNYTVYDYQKDGRKVINDVLLRNKTPIIVGGTGLYVKALLYDYEFNEENIKNDYDELSNEEIYNKLLEYDKNIEIHINNRKRLVRALNYYMNNSNVKEAKGNNLLYDVIFVGLTTDRDKLYEQINDRVDKMIKNGLIDEVKKLYDNGIRSKSIMTGIGYKELYQYFDNYISLDECIDLIKKNSRHYAKKQYTWFNNQMNITWFNTDFDDFNNTVNDVIKYIEKND
jgi:tRNA dimethylallyltransferase